MSGCSLASHVVRLFRRLLMLLILKEAIFNGRLTRKDHFGLTGGGYARALEFCLFEPVLAQQGIFTDRPSSVEVQGHSQATRQS